MKQDIVRILSHMGLGSRKECRKSVLRGEVQIGGEVLKNPKTLLETQGLQVQYQGQDYDWHETLWVMLHKPKGYECSHNPIHNSGVFDLLPWHWIRRGIQAAGRLDSDSSGLLLLSDDGQWIHKIISPRHQIAKRYMVTLKHAAEEKFLQTLEEGVVLKGEQEPVQALQGVQLDATHICFSITEGKYHQVRRMVAAAGNRVEELHRVSVGPLELGELEEGQWRLLSEQEAMQVGTP